MRSFECQYVFDVPDVFLWEIAPEFPNPSRASFVIRKNAPNLGNPRSIKQTQKVRHPFTAIITVALSLPRSHNGHRPSP
jgi:hypothetical protein